MKKFKWIMLLSMIVIISSIISNKGVEATSNIRLIVDGKDITSLTSPIIQNDRTLVPIRFVAEEIGAKVTWNNNDRTVLIVKGTKSILLRIDSHIVQYDNGTSYELSDVAPKIIIDRTFVPLRLISNALGINIKWDNPSRTVTIDSKKAPETTPFFDVNILTHKNGQTITGKTELQVSSSIIGNEIKYLLLDPKTAKGFVIARGDQINGKYIYTPKIEDKGDKILVAAIYDSNGKFIGGNSIAIKIDVIPKVAIKGIVDGQVIENSIAIGTDVNFVAAYVKYEITNLTNGKVTLTDEQDPQGTYNFNPMFEENGGFSIKATVYDTKEKAHVTNTVNITASVSPRLSLVGVSSGMTINKPVTLSASRNFNVRETEFIIKDVNTGVSKTLAKIPYGGYRWSPGPEFTGSKDLIVKVIDSRGIVRESNPVRVVVDGSPKILLEGIGPKQVVTGQTKVKTSSNVAVESVNYVLINTKTGTKRILASNINGSTEYTYTPLQSDIGDVIIQAEGIYQGKKLLSDKIQFRVFLGQTYGPKPIIEKDKFLGLASGLARSSYEKTGMSAALQTAQAILETGWGQSVPVDKYTGQLSNNLFGIKGLGPAGAVISNTWEVYNGITYRVDAEFRAYSNVSASWDDHKDFLLNRERYAPVKLVMHDYSQGAWALKRAGYATDPQYPIKLMRLINQYNLLELDKVGL